MKRSLKNRLPVLLILLLGIAMRLYHLGADSLWYDETVSVALAGSPAPELIRHTAGDIHPPGYYLLLRAWLATMGFSTGQASPHGFSLEFAAAFLSLLLGVLLIALTYTLVRRVAGHPTAHTAAALIALSPFNVWYSQEVRMYALGAVLGALALYALLRGLDAPATRPQTRLAWWGLYALAAAAGMYTLYYLAFLLVPVNVWVLVKLLRGGTADRRPPTGADGSSQTARQFSSFLLANAAALLLYAPWIPVVWRQATNPPVPPWRAGVRLVVALLEGWTALSFGQSAPAWLWSGLILTLGFVLLGIWALWTRPGGASPAGVLLAAAFGPFVLILAVSTVTPLYHVRYLFSYSPMFYVFLAAGLCWMWARQKAVAGVTAILWLAAAGVTLHAFWTDPVYRADDHRAAVRQLQEAWRPGDVLLVNAGYAYTALDTYWDGPVASRTRLTDPLPTPRRDAALVMVTSGHVNGDPGLGWGDPQSDFFALPAPRAESQIERLFRSFRRVWHYRIYDTVNDPEGLIRARLERDGQLVAEQVYQGEAYLRVQQYAPRAGVLPDPHTAEASFDQGLKLRVTLTEQEITASQSVYGAAYWQFTTQPQNFATSLRLIGPDGQVWAQPEDEQPSGPLFPAEKWPPGAWQYQPLSLRVPAGTPPGSYTFELVVYDPLTGERWEPNFTTSALAPSPNGIGLGDVTVVRTMAKISAPAAPLARFGPLALVGVEIPTAAIAPAGRIPVELLWQAMEAPGETLVIVLQLLNPDGSVAAGIEQQPVSGRHPTGDWLAGELVRDKLTLDAPQDLPPGDYRLIVGVYRAADRGRLETRAGLFGRSDHVVVGDVSLR